MLTSRLTLGCLTLFATVLAIACNPDQPPTAEPESVPNETVPVDSAATMPAETTVVDDTADRPLSRTGTFVSAEHETVGGVELIDDGTQRLLVFDETFSTSDGPDLVVVLHRSANVIAESTPPAYPLNEADYVVIAPLAATTGTQAYMVPAEINLAAFESVAVWCQEFNATFGAATLQ